MSKYQRALKETGSAEEAIRYTITHVGSALWITTLVLVTGFTVLSLSKMIGNSALGEVTAIILAAALMLDLLLLPALLLFIDGKKAKQ